MLSTRLVPSCNLTSSLYVRALRGFPAFGSSSYFSRSRKLEGHQNIKVPSNQRFNTAHDPHTKNTKMNMTVCSGVDPGPSVPSDPSSPHSWKMWIVGMLISVIIPFWKNKWWSLLTIKGKVESVVETAESVVEIVEKVAEEVEEVAEKLVDHLPEGGKLKAAVTLIENVAKETAKDAHIAGEVIDKVEEVEKEAEDLIEPLMNQTTSGTSKETTSSS